MKMELSRPVLEIFLKMKISVKNERSYCSQSVLVQRPLSFNLSLARGRILVPMNKFVLLQPRPLFTIHILIAIQRMILILYLTEYKSGCSIRLSFVNPRLIRSLNLILSTKHSWSFSQLIAVHYVADWYVTMHCFQKKQLIIHYCS